MHHVDAFRRRLALATFGSTVWTSAEVVGFAPTDEASSVARLADTCHHIRRLTLEGCCRRWSCSRHGFAFALAKALLAFEGLALVVATIGTFGLHELSGLAERSDLCFIGCIGIDQVFLLFWGRTPPGCFVLEFIPGPENSFCILRVVLTVGVLRPKGELAVGVLKPIAIFSSCPVRSIGCRQSRRSWCHRRSIDRTDVLADPVHVFGVPLQEVCILGGQQAPLSVLLDPKVGPSVVAPFALSTGFGLLHSEFIFGTT